MATWMFRSMSANSPMRTHNWSGFLLLLAKPNSFRDFRSPPALCLGPWLATPFVELYGCQALVFPRPLRLWPVLHSLQLAVVDLFAVLSSLLAHFPRFLLLQCRLDHFRRVGLLPVPILVHLSWTPFALLLLGSPAMLRRALPCWVHLPCYLLCHALPLRSRLVARAVARPNTFLCQPLLHVWGSSICSVLCLLLPTHDLCPCLRLLLRLVAILSLPLQQSIPAATTGGQRT